MIAESPESPLVIGGVGGSGTRIVTELIKRMGYYMGKELNSSNDNMVLAEMFPLMRDRILTRSFDTHEFILNTVTRFAELMRNDMADTGYEKWGWKIPADYMIIEYIYKYFSNMRYIHVIRNGLDMAFSANQNQAQRWGRYFDVNCNAMPLPKASILFWARANNYAIKTATKCLGDRFLLLNFDRLCQDPYESIKKIAEFLRVEVNADNLGQIISHPSSIGRHKVSDCSIFDESDYEVVRLLGFDV